MAIKRLRPRTNTPRAAYFHVPFCRHRCGYCNFTVVANRDDLKDAFIEALEREMASLEVPQEVDTRFIGGGTPTDLSPTQLKSLLERIDRWLPLAPGGEFSVEANPSDVDRATVAILRQFGVTRVSLGVQSFDPLKLKQLDRDHGPDQVFRAMELLQGAGMRTSIDLIFGSPGETLVAWLADLDAAIHLHPDHVSTYGLTIERGSRFYADSLHGRIHSVHEEVERAMYESAIDRLEGADFTHYEISNFCREGHACRHNQTYWNGATYWAFGPGAARHVDGKREINHRSTTTYLRRVLEGKSPVAESEQLDDESAARERLVFGLRQIEGIDPTVFGTETGFPLEAIAGGALEECRKNGLLQIADGKLKLTREGLLLADSVATAILSESDFPSGN